MTKSELNEIIRVCGEDFEESDVPALWREEKEKELDEAIKFGLQVEELERERELKK